MIYVCMYIYTLYFFLLSHIFYLFHWFWSFCLSEFLLLKNESHSARKLRATSNVRRPPSCLSPDYYLDAMIYERGYSVQRYSAIHSGYYNEPTPLQEECYQSWILDLIARNDKAAFKLLLECGLVNNPSNYFGSTAAHFAAKHGRIDILKLMIKYGCDIRIADEHGKTPLHSACIGRPGNQKTNFDMIEFIAKVDIRLFHLADTKGNVPLSYIPRNQWGMYNEFIESLLLDKYWPGRRAILMKYGEEAPPPLAVSKPNVRNEITRRIFTKFDKIINSASMDVTTTSSDDDDHDSCHSRMMESVFSNGSKDLYKRHSSSIVKILLSTITEQKKKMDIYHHPGDLATSYYDSNCSLKNAKSTSEGKIIDNCTTSLYDTIMARSQQFYRNADISDASKLHVGTESAKDVRNKSNSPLIDARSSDIAAKPEGGGYLGSAISTAVAQCDIYAGNNTGASLCSDHLSSTSAVGLVANKENDSSICFSIVDTNHNNDSSRASDDNAFVVELKQQHHSARNAVSPCSASLKKSTRQHQRLINHTSRNDLRISGDSFITKFRNNTLDRTNHSAPQATTNRTCSGSESRYNSTNADSKNVSERNIQNAVTRKNDIKSLVAALQNIAIRSGTSKVHNMNLGGCNDEQRKPQLKPRSTRSLQSIGSVIASSEASSRKRASMTRTCRATSLRRGFSIERIDV